MILKMRGDAQPESIPGYFAAAATAFAVLAFGAVEQLWLAPVQLAIFLAAGYVIWTYGLPQLGRLARSSLLLLIAVPLLQLVPLPSALVQPLGSGRSTLADVLHAASIPAPANLAISVYPYETVAALLRLVCYLLIFILAVHNQQKLRRQPGLLALLIGLGVFEAGYGIVQYLTGFQYIFFYKKAVFDPTATGTYINRNHYAGFLAMALPFLAASMLNHSHAHSGGSLGVLRRLLLTPQSSTFLRDAVLFVVVLVGLTFSLSRTGLLVALIGVAVASALMYRHRGRSGLPIILIIVAAGLGYAFWIGLAPLVTRFGELLDSTSDSGVRVGIWRDTLRLIGDFPLLGTGLGTYPWASLHYQTGLLDMRYEHAHNDILETAAELGIPVALILWGSIAALLIQLWRRFPRLHHSSERTLAAGCAGAITALLLHSLTDFNLQIPANALVFSWIAGCAAGLIQPRATHGDSATASDITIDVSPAD